MQKSRTFEKSLSVQEWYFGSKIVLVIEKNFWNSRLKEFDQWKVRTIFETECIFNLFLPIWIPIVLIY